MLGYADLYFSFNLTNYFLKPSIERTMDNTIYLKWILATLSVNFVENNVTNRIT